MTRRHAIQGYERLLWCDELHDLLRGTAKYSDEWLFYRELLEAVGGRIS